MDISTPHTQGNIPTTEYGNRAVFDLQRLKGIVHFIGIGGIGMSGLARLLLDAGIPVSGSDKQASTITEELARLGAQIFIGHESTNIADASYIVVSTAITDDNPELAKAKFTNLPIFHRSEVLAGLSAKKKLLAISGTHGKTTTTGMAAQVFLEGGLSPSVVVGGTFAKIQANSLSGTGEYFIAEADESDRTHADTKSAIAIVTNIEPDHLENYPGGLEQILQTMASFANGSENAIVCLDDEGCKKLLPLLSSRIITYGSQEKSPGADYRLHNLNDWEAEIYEHGIELGNLTLSVPGEHNKLNALSVIAAARLAGLDFHTIAKSLLNFGGVDRRFQVLGSVNGITIVDDYAHHPTEVAATLASARQYIRKHTPTLKRVVAVFQPHQPRRLRDLWQEFCQCFHNADLALITDIYIARGKAIEGISGEKLVQEMEQTKAQYLGGATANLTTKIIPYLEPGDLVLTIGAGDITSLGPKLLEQLAKSTDNGRST